MVVAAVAGASSVTLKTAGVPSLTVTSLIVTALRNVRCSSASNAAAERIAARLLRRERAHEVMELNMMSASLKNRVKTQVCPPALQDSSQCLRQPPANCPDRLRRAEVGQLGAVRQVTKSGSLRAM